MTQIPFGFDIVESDAQIEKLIFKELVNEFNRKLPKIVDSIQTQLQKDTILFLKSTDTYKSLVGGILAGHFGLPAADRQNMVDNILVAVANSINVTYKNIFLAGSQFKNGITITALLSNMSQVLSLPDASILIKDGKLDWLQWLLTAGDKIIIQEYDVKLMSGRGRSGLGIMVAEDAAVWRVPPAYAGTLKSNWLTRSLTSDVYLSIIEKIVKANLQRI